MEQEFFTYHLHMGPAKCAVDLGDGSERGSYVSQDYILSKLKRPHRAINLMYCYYPLDEGFPERASVMFKSNSKDNAWGYPYDDYFTYKGGLEGNTEGEPFTCMRDVRRHGQDIILTLTVDPHVSDEQLIAVAKDLTTFGRMQLRVNHEATGSWFSFNKRCTYQEVADFYVRFNKIIKEYAPNVTTILCIGGIEDEASTEIVMEKEFKEAVRETDVWSVDKYIALHYGWPNDVAEYGCNSYFLEKPEKVYHLAKRSFYRYSELCDGKKKPMVMSEVNVDGDVTGQINQAKIVRDFCNLIINDEEQWLTGFTLYQFRDDGRLGLEMTDPNNKEVGIEQPLLKEYRDIIQQDFFKPEMTEQKQAQYPVDLRWGGSEDAEGLRIHVTLDSKPVFFEVMFENELKDLNLMLCINNQWFYKAPGVETIDVMSAFYDSDEFTNQLMTLDLFAPPASGENEKTDREDWAANCYTRIACSPKFRIRYVPTQEYDK